MKFLPVFLDLQAGPILLVGAGELVRAKLRVLLAAGARVRWYATDGHYDVSGLDPLEAARIEHGVGDPCTAEINGFIAVLFSGGGYIGPLISAPAPFAGF